MFHCTKQKQLKINSKINRSLNFVKLVFMDNTEKLQSLENEILALVEVFKYQTPKNRFLPSFISSTNGRSLIVMK